MADPERIEVLRQRLARAEIAAEEAADAAGVDATVARDTARRAIADAERAAQADERAAAERAEAVAAERQAEDAIERELEAERVADEERADADEARAGADAVRGRGETAPAFRAARIDDAAASLRMAEYAHEARAEAEEASIAEAFARRAGIDADEARYDAVSERVEAEEAALDAASAAAAASAAGRDASRAADAALDARTAADDAARRVAELEAELEATLQAAGAADAASAGVDVGALAAGFARSAQAVVEDVAGVEVAGGDPASLDRDATSEPLTRPPGRAVAAESAAERSADDAAPPVAATDQAPLASAVETDVQGFGEGRVVEADVEPADTFGEGAFVVIGETTTEGDVDFGAGSADTGSIPIATDVEPDLDAVPTASATIEPQEDPFDDPITAPTTDDVDEMVEVVDAVDVDVDEQDVPDIDS